MRQNYGSLERPINNHQCRVQAHPVMARWRHLSERARVVSRVLVNHGAEIIVSLPMLRRPTDRYQKQHREFRDSRPRPSVRPSAARAAHDLTNCLEI